MKTQFPGYFSLTKQSISKLWDDGVFIFDANILLGLYRYSDATRKEFFSTLFAIKDRCWLPHQAVKEYFDNRLNVISKQEEAYADIVKSMDDMENKFKNAHQHPFLSPRILDRLCKDFEIARTELQKSQSFHTDRINKDDILAEIEKIFCDRVGSPFVDDELSKILVEGEDRYKRSVPPGFRDGRKDDPSDPTRKYGDLILWKQILKKVHTDKVSVIFVCDDRKDDWWLQFKGKTLGPRPELVKEFVGIGGTDFHIYSSDRFLEFAGEHFNRTVSKVAVSEMRELKRFDEERRKRVLDVYKRRREYDLDADKLQAEQLELMQHLQQTEIERTMLEQSSKALIEKIKSTNTHLQSSSDFNQLKEVSARMADIDHRLQMLHERLKMLVMQRQSIQLGLFEESNNIVNS
jgi:hypothetical protein